MSQVLHCGKYSLPLDRPLLMGVVNVTPDSFFDGGHSAVPAQAVAHARRLIDEGADIVDVGGESTRPGSHPVSPEEERRRVLPVLEALSDCGVPVSIDTQKPELMREAIAAGADMVNDVNAFLAADALAAVAGTSAALCFMHKRGDPRTMQDHPQYDDVVCEVREFLAARIEAAVQCGVARDRIAVDPGFGFGKTFEHNLELLRALGEFGGLGVPVLVGMSRKSMLGRITGRDADERVHASVAAAIVAVEKGARIVRVHDVAATRDALAVWRAVMGHEA